MSTNSAPAEKIDKKNGTRKEGIFADSFDKELKKLLEQQSDVIKRLDEVIKKLNIEKLFV